MSKQAIEITVPVDSLVSLEETFKLGVHLGLFGFGVACTLYNLGAWLHGRQHKNLTNVATYTALVAFEVYQMNVHWQARKG